MISTFYRNFVNRFTPTFHCRLSSFAANYEFSKNLPSYKVPIFPDFPDISCDFIYDSSRGTMIKFKNNREYSYYIQILNDLQKYHGVPRRSAFNLVHGFSAFNFNKEDNPVSQTLETRLPYYYATILAGTYYHGAKAADTVGCREVYQDPDVLPETYKYSQEFLYVSKIDKKTNESECVSSFENYKKKYHQEICHNQLYHGTQQQHAILIYAQGVNLDKGGLNLDFNSQNKRGFYTTLDEDQAKLWARRIARDGNYPPAIVVFDINLEIVRKLDGYKTFSNYQEWCDFVVQGRKGILNHNYKIVEGPFLVNVAGAVVEGNYPIPMGHQLAFYDPMIVINYLNNSKRAYFVLG